MLTFVLQAYERSLDFSAKKILLAADITKGIQRITEEAGHLPVRIRKWTVNRSPHIDKRSKDTFEQRIHSRLLRFHVENKQLSNKFKKFVVSTMNPGVGIKMIENVMVPISDLYTRRNVAIFSLDKPSPLSSFQFQRTSILDLKPLRVNGRLVECVEKNHVEQISMQEIEESNSKNTPPMAISGNGDVSRSEQINNNTIRTM